MPGSDLSSYPAVTGKCQACGITQIYPHGIYIIKSRAMHLSRSPQCRAFSRAVMDEKLLQVVKIRWLPSLTPATGAAYFFCFFFFIFTM